MFIQAIKAVYDGTGFKLKQPVPVQGHYDVIITFVNPIHVDSENVPKKEIRLGFLKDKVPALPDSFFDPLPEDELQL